MKTNPFITGFLAIVIIAASSACMANNNLFLPGDAFFPTVLMKADVAALQTAKTGARQFVYSSFGHKKKHLRLCCLIADQAAVERSWRDADVIAALTVKLPNVLLKPVPETKSPVVVQGSVEAIVIGSHSLKELFRYSDDDSLTIYIVDSKDITELVHEDGKWGPASSN